MTRSGSLTDQDYVALAEFRHTLRRFQAFSESKAAEVGLTPQQHQALLAIRAASPEEVTVGYIAQRLVMKPHSASGLIDRLEVLELVTRQETTSDRRRSILQLTDKAEVLLASLSETHRDEVIRLKPLLVDLLKWL
ncbi:MarR family transcriptional regulator (plasmid) [Sphingomonas paeninsulae]|uniref:MarR family transcriptional regulator n=1 Tax=Sphingomonas paeninsulae TaxID=2319844 RepID=A0A494THG3_SPHPE|nr:helix-turn-helix domain-containing protein [Sphingomonas paeninsulae]AYJ84615.1 MarR family transcriptional regulator [Sphingomonas paeninsulae]